MQKWCTQTFWSRVPKADTNHGLEPKGGASFKKVVYNHKFLEYDFMQKCSTQNFDLGPPREVHF